MPEAIPIVNSSGEIARDEFTKSARIKLCLRERPRLTISVALKECHECVLGLWILCEELAGGCSRLLGRGHWCATVGAPD
ncbi:hypothetical protein Halar_2217 [halophilic archaeon DL31]|jgi:hypothetical protein|nr:hypothetical protein Halar_2217 [halophilic archaeon DL31]